MVGIVYAGLVALVQDDFKFVIGYSSVSHMGFVLLGLAAANARAVSGAVLQMFSHGVIAGLLFAVVGRMVYDRTHTRRLPTCAPCRCTACCPLRPSIFVIAGLASMGMPGFSGFPAELTILVGAWKTSPAWALVAAVGVLVAAAFTLRAIQLAFFGPTGEPPAGEPTGPPAWRRSRWPERAGAHPAARGHGPDRAQAGPAAQLDRSRPCNRRSFRRSLKGGAP